MYLPGETGFAQHESIWPVAPSGQSARRQHSAAFWSAKAKLTQSPLLTRRTANPRITVTGLNRFIMYKVDESVRNVKSRRCRKRETRIAMIR